MLLLNHRTINDGSAAHSPGYPGCGAWIVAIIAGLLPAAVNGQLTGRQIAERVYDRDTGDDSYARATMQIYEDGEQTRSRELIVARKRQEDLERLYIRFTSPPSLDGTAFLTRENEDDRSDQFLFMPELGRARRIDLGQRSKRFVGSDFTYEDLEVRKVDTFTHELVDETTCGPDNQRSCWVVASRARPAAESQYSRLKRWIAKDALIDVRVDHYGDNDTLVRRLTVTDLQQVDGIWTAMTSEMADMQNDRRTVFSLQQIEYNRGIPDRMFTPAYLQQAD